MKSITTIYVDTEVKREALKQGLNVSQTCNTALWKAVQKEPEANLMQEVGEVLNEKALSPEETSNRELEAQAQVKALEEKLRVCANTNYEAYREAIAETEQNVPKGKYSVQKAHFWGEVLKLFESKKAKEESSKEEKGGTE
jgi:hypothetical protein